MNCKIIYNRVSFLFFAILLLSFSSDDKFFKPFEDYLFDRNGHYFLIIENSLEGNVKIVSNPYTIEKYKQQFEIRINELESTPQFSISIIKDNRIEKIIGYSNPSNLKTSKEFEKYFKVYKENRVEDISYSRYKSFTDSLDKLGVLWLGDKMDKYSGVYRIQLKISRDIDSKFSSTELSERLFDSLVNKYPFLINRLNISFQSSLPQDDFVVWKIDIRGDNDFSEFVKKINFTDNNLVKESSFLGYSEFRYNFRYFEMIN